MRKLRRLFFLLILACGCGLLWLYLEPDRTPPAPLPALPSQIDRIVIEKSARRMSIYLGAQKLREYPIALGFAPSGDKVKEGDGKTPEGNFKINRRNPQSAFTLSLGLDYPLPADIKRAKQGGYSPGGDIFIHGQPNKVPNGMKVKGDWTAGCIALTNTQMREIWAITPIGTSVEIQP